MGIKSFFGIPDFSSYRKQLEKELANEEFKGAGGKIYEKLPFDQVALDIKIAFLENRDVIAKAYTQLFDLKRYEADWSNLPPKVMSLIREVGSDIHKNKEYFNKRIFYDFQTKGVDMRPQYLGYLVHDIFLFILQVSGAPESWIGVPREASFEYQKELVRKGKGREASDKGIKDWIALWKNVAENTEQIALYLVKSWRKIDKDERGIPVW